MRDLIIHHAPVNNYSIFKIITSFSQNFAFFPVCNWGNRLFMKTSDQVKKPLDLGWTHIDWVGGLVPLLVTVSGVITVLGPCCSSKTHLAAVKVNEQSKHWSMTGYFIKKEQKETRLKNNTQPSKYIHRNCRLQPTAAICHRSDWRCFIDPRSPSSHWSLRKAKTAKTVKVKLKNFNLFKLVPYLAFI